MTRKLWRQTINTAINIVSIKIQSMITVSSISLSLAIKIAFRLASSVDSLHVIIYLSLRYAISRNKFLSDDWIIYCMLCRIQKICRLWKIEWILIWLGLGLLCFSPFSTIFQLYRGGLVLLVEKTRRKFTSIVVIDTDCTGSCKSNYHTITTTTAPTILCNISSLMWMLSIIFFSNSCLRELKMLCYITYIVLRVECSCYDHWSFFHYFIVFALLVKNNYWHLWYVMSATNTRLDEEKSVFTTKIFQLSLYSCIITHRPYQNIDDFVYRFGSLWLHCSRTLLNYLAFQSVDYERIWWRLFQKRVVRTECDIYVFIKQNDNKSSCDIAALNERML
jgi:hypothetical protein